MLEGLAEYWKILSPVWETLRVFVFPAIGAWWWVPLPFLLWRPASQAWLWWRRELDLKKRKYVVLEIKLPGEILKPIKAMERVFDSLYAVVSDHDTSIFRETWIEGENTFYTSLSLEIVGINGSSHFFVRTEDIYRDAVESAIYSQYSEVEIIEVTDYTQYLPQDLPNDEWDLEGREWILKRPSCYPVLTYEKFETGTETKEEKRIDPIAGLLEGLSMLKEGEQVWIQIILNHTDRKWIEEGELIRNKLVKRPGPAPAPRPMIQEAAEIIVFGPPKEQKKEEKKELIPPEMMLTPGEREIVKEIENKISKPGFEATVRTLYLARRETMFKPHLGLPINFFVKLNTSLLNYFGKLAETTTKVKTTWTWFWDKRIAFSKKRTMFRNYVKRFNPFFPRRGGTSVLNSEELATVFHFPGRTVAAAPSVPRIEAKKGEAPPDLPIG